MTVITHRATVEGDLSSFNATQYRVGLASLLPGVSPNDVRLAVSAGSIVIDATIEVSAEAQEEDPGALDTLFVALGDVSTDDLASATGAPVLSLEPPVVTVELAAPMPPPPPSPPRRTCIPDFERARVASGDDRLPIWIELHGHDRRGIGVLDLAEFV